MAKLTSPIWILSFVLAACASGNCRQIHTQDKLPTIASNDLTPPAPEPKATEMTDEKRVLVYKNDGSLQCSKVKAQSPEEMVKELKGIKIFSSVKKSDGLMHVQACGTPSGKVNVFEILEKDLPSAQKKGFKFWNLD